MENNDGNELILNLAKLHTTKLGIERIKKNLDLGEEDVVSWCRELIRDPSSQILRKGKNWYIRVASCEITVNAHSYTIITAHQFNKKQDKIKE